MFAMPQLCEFGDFKILRSLSCVKNKCCEHNMMWKLCDALGKKSRRNKLVLFNNYSLQVQKKMKSEVNFEDVSVHLRQDNIIVFETYLYNNPFT